MRQLQPLKTGQFKFNIMYYLLEESEYGDCLDKQGNRVAVNECNKAYTPEGENVGYTFFETREEMLEAWELTERKD